MGDYVEFAFADGQKVLLEVFPDPAGDDRGPLVPVAGGGRVARVAGVALRETLRPLVPVLESVYRTVGAVDPVPESVTVELGVKISSDLQLGIVAGGAEASITVSATWNLGTGTGTGTGTGSGSG